MARTKFRFRCANPNCGRLWEGEFCKCQKCGHPTELVDLIGNVVDDPKKPKDQQRYPDDPCIP